MKSKLRLVVCEDNEMICALLKQALVRADRDVIITRTAAECRAACAHDDTQVLLTDLILKGEDMLGLIRQLRREQPALGLIVLTGGGEHWVEAALNHGAEHILEKPIDMEILVKAVERIMTEHEMSTTAVG